MTPKVLVYHRIASKINNTPNSVRLSEKLQLTAALYNEIWPQ